MSLLQRGASLPRELDRDGNVTREPVHPPDAFIRPDGWRDLSIEGQVQESEGNLVINCNTGPTIAVVELDAIGLEFLAAHLPDGDGFTEILKYAKRLAPKLLGARETA